MNSMNNTIKQIINGDDENNRPMKEEVNNVVNLLNEMRIEFSHKMEEVLKPVYKKVSTDPIDVLLLPDLKLTEKLIMVILNNRDNATINQLKALTGSNTQTCNKALNNLRNRGYIIKLKMSTYALPETKIF